VLHSGAPRYEPHVDRKFSAIEAVEEIPKFAHAKKTDFDVPA
jgi:hypothetical protein